MGNSNGIEIKFNRLLEIAANYRSQAGREVSKAAHAIEAQTKANITQHDLIDTGNMLGSVQAQPDGTFAWLVGVGAEYAIYHEYGTVKLPPKPFFLPAVRAIEPQFYANMERLIERSK
jgi:HK97 gp10 family phage protein